VGPGAAAQLVRAAPRRWRIQRRPNRAMLDRGPPPGNTGYRSAQRCQRRSCGRHRAPGCPRANSSPRSAADAEPTARLRREPPISVGQSSLCTVALARGHTGQLDRRGRASHGARTGGARPRSDDTSRRDAARLGLARQSSRVPNSTAETLEATAPTGAASPANPRSRTPRA
jgi:hypothetical protein